MDIFESLNDKQMLAVEETEGYVRVIAGAGSGKTKLLVSRYAYLVKEYGINPGNILCVTFTNKAASEMKKRIKNLIGPEYSTSLICTYHGFCARLIRENPEKFFLTKEFQIIDPYQQKVLLEEIFQKYELKLDTASFQSFLKRIALKKQDISYVKKMITADKVQILPEIKDQDDQIIEDYLQKQKAIYSLDFTDLMSYALYLLKTDDEIRLKWQQRLNYIQVDEFQDSSRTEMELIDVLSGLYHNVMIVGDPDQNIYEWRGSDVKLLVNFDQTHPDTKTIILNQNYRSTPQILKCANTLIEKNSLRLKKDLFTQSNSGANVVHYHSKSEEAESAVLVKEIKKIKQKYGKSYSDFAILYRSGFLSRKIERKLVEENIPYEIYGGVKFYQRMEILDIVAYLRLIAFSDDLSFTRIVNTPKRQFGRTKMKALKEMRERNDVTLFDGNDIQNKTLYEVLKTHLGDSVFKGSDVGSFISMIEKMKTIKAVVPLGELVNQVCIQSGYEQYIRELGDEDRLDNLSEFKRIVNEYEANSGESITLEEFLQQIALMSSEDTDVPAETVKLMTIHASKGLEFPVVFITGLSEGIFPSSKTMEERKKLGLEEERRLCYVSITRAREFLYLLDSEGFNQQGIKKLPSRFLYEIGEENYRRIGKIDENLERESFGYIQRLNVQMRDKFFISVPPETLEHHIFGKGKVLNYDEKRGVFLIKFDKIEQPRSIAIEYFNQRHDRIEHKPPEVKQIPFIPPEKKEVDRYKSFCEDIEQYYGDDMDRFEQEVMAQEDRALMTIGRVCDPPTEVEELLKNTPNQWKNQNFPKTGWICTGITDLGGPLGVCQMCGFQIIRYVHHMKHVETGITLDCGCNCAGKLEGNIEQSKAREANFKNKEQRKLNFLKKKWKKSAKGNLYLKINAHFVVLLQHNEDEYFFSIDGEYSGSKYNTPVETKEAIFEALEVLKEKDKK